MSRPTKRIERNDAATLARITDEILQLRARIGRDLYEIGNRLRRIRDQELWCQGTYESFDEYLEAAVGLSRATAYRFISIATHFNRRIANTYGVAKLEAAIGYLNATPLDERPSDLMSARVRIRGDDGRYRTIPFARATAEQLREATRLLREAQRHGTSRHLDPAFAKLASSLPKAPTGSHRGPRVRLRQARDGRIAVTFHAIPLDELDSFSRALLAYLRA